jgi:hypothetical protein
MEFSDIYLSAEEFFEILKEAWEKSAYFTDWEKRYHPEDLFNNFDVVAHGVGEGIISYAKFIFLKRVVSQSNRVPVFGGTVPSDTFGDNV